MELPHAMIPPDAVPGAFRAPKGACDTHVHLLGGPADFPLWEGRVEDPAPGPDFDGWLARYRAHLAALGCSRGVIVHSILYGGDNAVTVAAVRAMGPGFRGIGLLPDGADDGALDQFVDWGMAGVRLNYVHGGLLSWEGAQAMAPGLAERGLHLQMLAHADQHMADLAAGVRACPVPVVFDHMAWPSDRAVLRDPLGNAGVRALVQLVEEGHAWVKLSGFNRLGDAPYGATDALLRALVAANPEQCLWGSDWPHLMLNGAGMPAPGAMLDVLARVVPDAETLQRILVENPARLYGF